MARRDARIQHRLQSRERFRRRYPREVEAVREGEFLDCGGMQPNPPAPFPTREGGANAVAQVFNLRPPL
jgi:hypothetical protein